MIDASSAVLPDLRSDLSFSETTDPETGQPCFIIYDPLQHRYFKINETTYHVVKHWGSGLTVPQFTAHVSSKFGIQIDEPEIIKLTEFLSKSNFLETENWQDWEDKKQSAKLPLLKRIFLGHLFFKIPILKPKGFLEATSPLFGLFFTRRFVQLLCLVAVLALYLASRQWDQFVSQFGALWSFQGTLYFLAALFIVKVFHEIGHAAAAHRFGCRVSSMGVAFMFFMPMFYTDVSDAWRLKSKQERMTIAGAGVLFELAIAVFATFLWVFTADGPVRDILLVMATTSWVMSVFVNLNPFVKFDGYYLLSDYSGIANLQSRSFALASWRIKTLFFAPNLSAPEALPSGTRSLMIAYAIGAYIHRVFIAITIILLAYHFTFKLLAIALFIVEFWLLIGRPIVSELSRWLETDRSEISSLRLTTSIGCVLALVALLFVPIFNQVNLPAVMQAKDTSLVYASGSGKIVSINVANGENVSSGQPLIVIKDMTLETRIESTKLKLKSVRERMNRALALKQDRENLLVLRQEYQSLTAELSALQDRNQELIVTAPISGKIVQMSEGLHVGTWVDDQRLIAVVNGNSDQSITGFVQGDDIDRITTSSVGNFIPNDITRPAVPVTIQAISDVGITHLNQPELLDFNGGSITTVDREGRTQQSQYMVRMTTSDLEYQPNQITLGIVQLNGEKRTGAEILWTAAAKVIVRELNF